LVDGLEQRRDEPPRTHRGNPADRSHWLMVAGAAVRSKRAAGAHSRRGSAPRLRE
jgi:hypothetical protein